MSLAAVAAAVVMQGCATSSPSGAAAAAGTNAGAMPARPFTDTNPVSAVGLAQPGSKVVHGDEIGIEKNAPVVEGHPMTSVVVTQCNLVVAVYMTMPDGRLLRFDAKADIAAEELVGIAYTATRSERVEVACEGMGAAGYETHGPT